MSVTQEQRPTHDTQFKSNKNTEQQLSLSVILVTRTKTNTCHSVLVTLEQRPTLDTQGNFSHTRAKTNTCQ